MAKRKTSTRRPVKSPSSPRRRPPLPCVALIADIVRSRRFHGKARERLQQKLEVVLGQLNETYESVLLSRFTITIGDEFQALFHTAEPVADLLWDLESALSEVELRIGIGHGKLDTELKQEAVGMDGPVWHQARDAVEEAKKESLGGGVFRGFKNADDDVLNGMTRLLFHVRSQWTDRQRSVIRLLRDPTTVSQTEVARRLNLSRQAVHNRLKSTGWAAWSDAEKAFRQILSQYKYSEKWQQRLS
jgi:predicted DNA-binding protein YlxM (UPF0122 family)